MVLLGFNRSPMPFQTFNKLRSKYQSFFTTVQPKNGALSGYVSTGGVQLQTGEQWRREKMPP